MSADPRRVWSADRYDRQTPPRNAVTHIVRYYAGDGFWGRVECHSYAGAREVAARYQEAVIRRVAP